MENQNKNVFCIDSILPIILVAFFCMFLLKFLKNRTVNIENFDSTQKINYSIDGHKIELKEK